MPASSKHKVGITYSSVGAVPPVFVSGAFTQPPWKLVELEYQTSSAKAEGDKHEYTFFKDFEVEEGDWQYKFRLGAGDWWVCDENAEIVTDDAGNRNNLLVVAPEHLGHSRKSNAAETGMECQTEGLAAQTQKEALFETADQQNTEKANKGQISDMAKTDSDISALENTPSTTHDRMASKTNPTVSGVPITIYTSMPSIKKPVFLQDDSFVDSPTPDKIDRNFKDTGMETRRLSKADVDQVRLLMTMSRDRLHHLRDMSSQEEQINQLERQYSSTSMGKHTCDYMGVPLLSHECLSFDDLEPIDDMSPDSPDGTDSLFMPSLPVPVRQNSSDFRDFHEGSDGFARSPTEEDLTDPLLEIFPSNRKAILKRLDTLRMEIPADGSVSSTSDGADDQYSATGVPYLPHELPPRSPSDTRARRNSSRASLVSPTIKPKSKSPSFSRLDRSIKAHGGSSEDRRSTKMAVPEESVSLEIEEAKGDLGQSSALLKPLELPDATPRPSHEECEGGFPISLEGDTSRLLGSSAAELVDTSGQNTRHRGAKMSDPVLNTTPDQLSRPFNYASDPETESSKMRLWRKFLHWFSHFWGALLKVFGSEREKVER